MGHTLGASVFYIFTAPVVVGRIESKQPNENAGRK